MTVHEGLQENDWDREVRTGMLHDAAAYSRGDAAAAGADRGPAMTARTRPLLIAGALAIVPPAGLAGMPAPISSNSEKVYHLDDSPLLQTTTVGVCCSIFPGAVQCWKFL